MELYKIISELAVVALLKAAGFPPKAIPTMVCVAKYESSFRTDIINTNRNNSKDYGLFQINDYWWGKRCDINRLLDPIYNVECAKLVYDTQGLNAWVAYKNNKTICDNYKVKK